MEEKELNLDFCSKFNYPKEIQELLRKIVGILTGEGVLSILTLGSLPRGELSYRIKNGKLTMFSDIDLLVVTEHWTNRERQAVLIKKLRDLRKKFQSVNPLFDITAEFLSLHELKKLPFKVIFYDLKESGKAIFGQDIRYMIPEFDAGTQNVKDTNNIILRRLFFMLLYFPKELLEDKKIASAQDAFQYIVARDGLHIATVLLFQEGLFFPTYRERVEYITSKADDFISDFGPDFPDFLTKSLKAKLDMDFSQSLTPLLEETLRYLKLLLSRTLKNNGVDIKMEQGLSILLKRTKKDIFGERDITKTKLKFVLKSPNPHILQKRLKALFYSFLGGIIFFLLNMNEALCLYLKDDRRCLSVLDDSWWALVRLGILSGEEDIPEDFVNRFLALREDFFLKFYIKFMVPEIAGHVEKALNWKYE